MDSMQDDSKTESAPQTSGITLHRPGHYDLFTGLVGLGVNRPNSRMVIEMAGIKPGDKVLDVGCGTGNLTLTVKNYVGESGSAYGLDASPEMIAAARKKQKRSGIQAVFDVGLIEQIPYPEATFDAVISRLAIHHLPGDLKRQGFSEIFRVLKPGGFLFVVDFNLPSNPFWGHVLLPFLGHRMMQTNMSGLPALIREAGFVEVASRPTRSAFLGSVRGKKPIQT